MNSLLVWLRVLGMESLEVRVRAASISLVHEVLKGSDAAVFSLSADPRAGLQIHGVPVRCTQLPVTHRSRSFLNPEP